MPGFPKGVHLIGGQNAAPVLAELAREFYEPIIPIVLELREKGLSLRAIARELEQRGIRPRLNHLTGGWSAAQVRRALIRATGGKPDPAPVRAAPAEAPSIELWINGAIRGPYTSEQVRAMLAAGTATLDTLGMREGTDEWCSLGELFGVDGGGATRC